MKKKMILSRQEIQARVRELGRTISQDYQGGKLVMIGVLNGAFIFMADLARAVDLQLEVDFIRVASYGQSDSSSGKISLSKDVEMDLAGKDVLLVEDIIDTGRTLAYLKDYFSRHRPASVTGWILPNSTGSFRMSIIWKILRVKDKRVHEFKSAGKR